MNIIKVQVRDNGEYLEGFFYDEHKRLNSFCFREGHNEASEDYRLECSHVPSALASLFITKMQAYYDSLPESKVMLKMVQRLIE